MSGTLCHAGLVVFCAQWLTLEVCYEILYKLTFDISQIYKHSLIGSCDKDSLLLCNAIAPSCPPNTWFIKDKCQSNRQHRINCNETIQALITKLILCYNYHTVLLSLQ